MIRSLYSGVAGLKSQQTKMDVIGNNIANVGTYGYKSSRATFQDVYYQTQTAATAASGNTGGTNSMQVGYGNAVSSIDTNTQTSAMSATGYNLDIAIAGEGFLQVMGADGNIMYTKAGMLDIDADGNLVDVNGNFVLGVSGDTSAPASSEKINISLPYLNPSNSEVTEKINNVSYTITSSNYTNKGNVNFSFRSSTALPVGQKMSVEVSGSSINVTLNAYEYFKNMDEFNSYLNQAITDANGGEQHAAGTFTISSSDESMFDVPLSPVSNGKPLGLTGAEIIGNNFGYELGKAGFVKSGDDGANVASVGTATALEVSNTLKNLFSISSVNSGFQGDTRTSATTANENISLNDTDKPAGMDISFNGNGVTIKITSEGWVDPVTNRAGAGDAVYVGTISYEDLNGPGEVILRREGSDDETDSMVINYPEYTSIRNAFQKLGISSDSLNAMDNLKKGNDEFEMEPIITGTDSNGDPIYKVAQVQRKNADGTPMVDGAGDPVMEDLLDSDGKPVIEQKPVQEKDTNGNPIVDANGDPVYKARTISLDAKGILNLRHTEPSRDLGLGQKSFTLKGGTVGGEQTVANLTAISIGSNGVIVGVHDVYGVVELGRVDLATFANPAGLTKVGSTYFDVSLNSGDPIVVNAGTEGTGEIMASTLEASNVDLSSEFSDMIMTQRGFQASSRVITVSDTMLEELINLKR